MTTNTKLSALVLAAATLTTATMTGAHARGFTSVAHVASVVHVASLAQAAPRTSTIVRLANQANQGGSGIVRVASPVATVRSFLSPGMGAPRLPVTHTCGFSNCAPVPAPVSHKPPPSPNPDPNPNPGPPVSSGAGGGDKDYNCDGDRDCGIFRQD